MKSKAILSLIFFTLYLFSYSQENNCLRNFTQKKNNSTFFVVLNDSVLNNLVDNIKNEKWNYINIENILLYAKENVGMEKYRFSTTFHESPIDKYSYFYSEELHYYLNDIDLLKILIKKKDTIEIQPIEFIRLLNIIEKDISDKYSLQKTEVLFTDFRDSKYDPKTILWARSCRIYDDENYIGYLYSFIGNRFTSGHDECDKVNLVKYEYYPYKKHNYLDISKLKYGIGILRLDRGKVIYNKFNLDEYRIENIKLLKLIAKYALKENTPIFIEM